MNITLGFNLIVKNEENCLEKTLANIRPIADEIIVTDTGSSDGTVAIAERYADQVLFHAWQDSFSEARNWSLAHSTTDFVCWIDADEWIENPDIVRPTLQKHPDANTFVCAMNNEMPSGFTTRHYLPKIFRRGTAHFEGIVHNQLIHEYPAYATEIIFGHSGYNESEEIMRKKQARTIRLLRLQLAEDPENTFALLNLARSLWNEGDLAESEEMADRGLALETKRTEIRQHLIYQKALCELKDTRDTVFKTLYEGLSINPQNLDFLFLKAQAHLQAGDPVNTIILLGAYDAAKETQAVPGAIQNLMLDFWDVGTLADEMLAEAYFQLGLWLESKTAARRVLAMDAQHPEIWRIFIQCCKNLGDFQGAAAAEDAARRAGIHQNE